MTLKSARSYPRRDRHQRGIHGVVIPWNLPGRMTRSEQFDDLVVRIAMEIARRAKGKADGIEIAVEDVPASDPAPWEQNMVALSRSFPADRSSGLPPRVVIYRRPVETRSRGSERVKLIHELLLTEMANLLGCFPDDLDS